jgi:hypothetical protein
MNVQSTTTSRSRIPNAPREGTGGKMESQWPVTEQGEKLIAMGTHWRLAVKKLRGLGKIKVRQYGRYYWQQCWRGVRLRFRVMLEEPVR